MADSDKNILITPSTGASTLPSIEFAGGDNNDNISLNVLDDGTISISGSAGQLFSISDSLTGIIFSISDVSGLPSIEVDDLGTVKLAEYSGNVIIGSNVEIDSAGNMLVGNENVIPEFGLNANGSFTKFPDGTLICNHILTSSATGETTWTFPTAFIDAEWRMQITASNSTTLSQCGRCIVTGSANGQFSVYNTSNVRIAVNVMVQAIGRWK